MEMLLAWKYVINESKLQVVDSEKDLEGEQAWQKSGNYSQSITTTTTTTQETGNSSIFSMT